MSSKLIKWAVVASLVAGVCWWFYSTGYSVATGEAAKVQVELIAAAVSEYNEKQVAVNEAGAALEEKQSENNVRFRTITKEVIKYVQVHPTATECLDAYGVRIWRMASQTGTGKLPAKHDEKVSRTIEPP